MGWEDKARAAGWTPPEDEEIDGISVRSGESTVDGSCIFCSRQVTEHGTVLGKVIVVGSHKCGALVRFCEACFEVLKGFKV